MRLLIIGGSDAGISAALQAHELAPEVEVTVVVADSYPNFSICGLPYYLSGDVPDWQALAHRTRAEIDGLGISLLLDHVATAIDPARKSVRVQPSRSAQLGQLESSRETATLDRAFMVPYDRLIIATGARPRIPAISGLEQDGVYLLHTMDHSFALHRHLVERAPQRAVIVGAGYIGMEMAEALSARGIATTLLQRGPYIHPSVDPAFSGQLAAELARHVVSVITQAQVSEIARDGAGLVVRGRRSPAEAQPAELVALQVQADLVLVATGVLPATELAEAAGVRLGAAGAIRVTRSMATTVPDISAAGDCVETHHRLLPEPTYLPLGTTAHKQGRVAGENAVGGNRLFAGSVGTQVVKVCELVVARTGLLESEARAAGYDPLTAELTAWDHKVYYPGARELHLRLTADRQSRRVLGAQILGPWGSEVAERIDIVAAALYQDLGIRSKWSLKSGKPKQDRDSRSALQTWIVCRADCTLHGVFPPASGRPRVESHRAVPLHGR
ncbi:MAG: FAD-dependent oxidoreductase [Ktedonobacterales bacterium]